MDYPIHFARHFARLVSLLLHEPANVDEQKAALRAMVTISREGPVHLVCRVEGIVVNASPLPGALPGVRDLFDRMRGHAVDDLKVDAAAAPADILGVARALAGASRDAVSPGALTLVTVRVGAAASSDAGSSTAALPSTPPAPPVSTAGIVNLSDGLAMELELVEPEEAQAAIAEQYAADVAPVAPRTVDQADVMAAFASLLREGDAQAILGRLDDTSAPHLRASMLEEIAVLAERSAREGKALLVADLTGGLVRREAAAPEGADERRMLARTVRRLLKGGLLRQVAMLLPRKRGRIEEYEAVLMRAGEDGADALIEQLTQATTAEDRRTYYNLLVRLRAGVSALVHMLGDHRWYVVRNAADLLGELQSREGEEELTALLRHGDERVRRAAVTALVRLGTVDAVHDLLHDAAPEMRLLAATALGGSRESQTASTLVSAYEKEGDEEVRLAIVAALGRVGTADAVRRLAQIAEPGGRLFRKKPAALRLAAVQALADARAPAAQAALRTLSDDREKEVRDAAVRALARG